MDPLPRGPGTQSAAPLPLARFRPRLLDSLHGYSRARLVKDIGAGLTVGIVALPLAMAFAIASGVNPQAGLTTAIVGGFLISLLGGSRVQIGGPAGAFIVVVYGIVERYGLANLLICTMLAGVLLFMMGLLRLGQLVRYIPVPIVIGFTNGIAVLVALSQIKDALGLQLAKVPADFFSQVVALGRVWHTVSAPAAAVCAGSLLLIVLWPKSYRLAADAPRWMRLLATVPGTLVALVAAAATVHLAALPVDTLGTRYGGIPQALPMPALPDISWDLVGHLLAPTLTIALLGAVESLLCARVADNLIDDRHDANQELMAQGIANLAVPLFGGIPATGTIARTVTNVKSGATSPVSGMVHALTLLAVVLLAAPLAAAVPLAALAAILLFVAFNMGEWHEFVRLRRFAPGYRVVLLASFALTVAVDLTVAIQIGLLLSALFFITRISSLTRVVPVATDATTPGEIAAYRIVGSLFFGAVDKLEALGQPEGPRPKIVILDLSSLLSIDATGIDALDSLRRRLQKLDCRLILAGAAEQPLSILHRSGFVERLGSDTLVPDLESALQAARRSARS